MLIKVQTTSDQMGKKAADHAAGILNDVLKEQETARIVLSTGASQFDLLKHFVQQPLDWSRIDMFHLDEYVGLSEQHPASFRKYLKERFLQFAKVRKAHLVNGEIELDSHIRQLNAEIATAPVDLGFIGIGENAHIAFNDPPADFDNPDGFIVVDLDEACKKQQVGEGWFEQVEDVPKQAITMTVQQIMRCRHIISCVPHRNKAEAIRKTIESSVTNQIPATMLKTHNDWTLYLDEQSASGLSLHE